jgi:hypothetical protein
MRRGVSLCRIERLDLNSVLYLLPDAEVVRVGVNIEDVGAKTRAHLAEFDVPDLFLFDPVNELAGRSHDIGARIIPSTVFLNVAGRVSARLQRLIDTREVAALAGLVA